MDREDFSAAVLAEAEEVSAVAAVLAAVAAASAAAALRGAGEAMDANTYFSVEEQEKIRLEVAAAESRTSGEIVPMIVGSSNHYAEAGVTCLIAGLLVGAAAALVWGDPWG